MIKIIVPALSLLFCLVSKAEAIDIVSTGSYSEIINAADLIAGAGSDLNATYQSATNAVTLTISNALGANWAIDVRKTDGTWNGNFILKVKKTTGTAITTVVGSSNVEFFQGTGDGSFNVQILLEGVSIAVAPNVHNTTITYTVRTL